MDPEANRTTDTSTTGIDQTEERTNLDKSYFLRELKDKNIQLDQEINKLKTRINTISKDNNACALEKRYEALNQEVHQLEGILADYNLAVEKQTLGTTQKK